MLCLFTHKSNKTNCWVVAGSSIKCSLRVQITKSQTLIVSSDDAETIFVPSGQNATHQMMSLWAFVFLAFSSSVAAREGRSGKLWPRRGDLGPKTHLRPRL